MFVLLGTLAFVAATVPLVAAAWMLAGLFSTERVARLATTLLLTMVVSVLILTGLGLAGLWYPIWQILAAWATLGIVWFSTKRLEPGSHSSPASDSEETEMPPYWVRFVTVASLAAALVLGIVVLVFFADGWKDSVLYHRGMLQDFLNARSLWHIGSFDNGIAYEGAYPSNAELFAFWTALPFERDFLTGIHGFVWMGATLGAMYTIGRDLSLTKWRATIAATLLFLVPATFLGQFGGLMIDSLVVCGAVFAVWGIIQYVRSPSQARWLVLVGLSSGLAVGAKLTALGLFVLLCAGLGISAWRRGHRFAWLVVLISALLPLGAWLLRLWVMRGNPLWPIELGPLPGAAGGWAEGSFFPDTKASLARLALSGEGFGQLVAMLIAAVIIMWGIVVPLICVSPRAIWRWARSEGLAWPLVLAPVVALVAHVVTPTTGLNPWYAANALRYVNPEIMILGLALGVVRLASESDRSPRWLALFAVAILVNWVAMFAFHTTEAGYLPMWVWIPTLVAGMLAGWWVLRPGGADRIGSLPDRHVVLWGCGVAIGAILVATWVARNHWWYPDDPLNRPYQDVYDWVSRTHGANIAFAAMYRTPLAGSDLSNTVYYVGEPRENHGTGVWRDPDKWIDALRDTCTDYLAVGRLEGFGTWFRPIPEWQWAQERPDVFRKVAGDEDTAVYEFLPRNAKPAVCLDPFLESPGEHGV